MHNAAFAAAGIAALYEACRITAEQLPEAIAGLRSPDVLGANLSLPHKEAALPLLDELTPAAQAIGAVNTIVHREGRLIGDNTDAPGLHQSLADLGVGFGGAPAVVLGAGGAARAAVYALLFGLGRDVYLLNRTVENARRLAQTFPSSETGARVVAALREEVPWAQVGLVVNASSAGLDAPDESPLPDFPALARGALVYDMVYKPAETCLMRDARLAGYRAENGLTMLAQQARLAFLAWTVADVPVAVFLEALGLPGTAGAEGGPR